MRTTRQPIVSLRRAKTPSAFGHGGREHSLPSLKPRDDPLVEGEETVKALGLTMPPTRLTSAYEVTE